MRPTVGRTINGVPFDEAAESLFELMRLGFDREGWWARLGAIPGIDVLRAENELRLLDLFAAQYALRTAPTPGWRNNAAVLFDDLLARLTTNCEAAGNSADDLLADINNRINAYSAAAAVAEPIDPDDIERLIGMTYAILGNPKYSLFDAAGERDINLFAPAFSELFLDRKNATAIVAEDLFKNRVTSLHTAMRSRND